MQDFGRFNEKQLNDRLSTQLIRVPAALLCYWLGASELDSTEQPVSL
jgi:hypothetical protein